MAPENGSQALGHDACGTYGRCVAGTVKGTEGVPYRVASLQGETWSVSTADAEVNNCTPAWRHQPVQKGEILVYLK